MDWGARRWRVVGMLVVIRRSLACPRMKQIHADPGPATTPVGATIEGVAIPAIGALLPDACGPSGLSGRTR